jgi:transglutaminase-like putative cysteine protease
MLLRIVHDTTYRYDPPVVTALHLAHLSPVDQPGQRLLGHRLDISPAPAQRRESTDAFGNPETHFTLPGPHDRLTVQADSLVDTAVPDTLPPGQAWDAVAEAFRYKAGTAYDPAAEFVFASPYVPHHRLLADFAHPVFEPGRPLLDAATALMRRIHTEMAYASGSTGINTPVLDALAQRKGVCQDFAHLMIGCLRSLGLPARYVSGYMLTQPPPGQPRLIGADASHAWVQVYDPQAGWADFDPTNDLCGLGRPAETHVTLALGRDFGDVSPLRGVIQGGGSPQLAVAVTVAPPAELAALQAHPPSKTPQR